MPARCGWLLAAMPGLLAGQALACELLLSEHRSGRELQRLPLDAALPQLQVAFTHSVLGTPVTDVYRWQGRSWHLREERFEGQGYGLPHAAGEGEVLVRDGDGWRLSLDRQVQPLVVRPLPALGMRVSTGIFPERLLGSLSDQAIELRALGC